MTSIPFQVLPYAYLPCPLGWGSATRDTILLARLATESGFFPLFEAEYGEVVSATRIRRLVPVEEYLSRQQRFAHLFRGSRDEERIGALQAIADRNIAVYDLLPAEGARS